VTFDISKGDFTYKVLLIRDGWIDCYSWKFFPFETFVFVFVIEECPLSLNILGVCLATKNTPILKQMLLS
jgi:hypothetical protein